MIQLNPRQLKDEASRLLTHAREPKKLVLIHTGVLVLLTLLGSGINLYLDSQISSTGGLSGMGLRTVLQTFQQFLQYATALFTPFWQAGFLLVTIRWATQAAAGPRDLLSGFKRFGGILGHQLWTSLLYLNLLFIAMYISTTIVAMTPFGKPLMEITDVMYNGTQEAIDALTTQQIMTAYAPMLVLGMAIYAPFALFFHYTLRPSAWLLMREQKLPVFIAMRASAFMMRKNRWQLVKLDLSYWWYYLLEGLTTLVAYLDVILVMLGVPLPLDPTVAFIATLVLYGALNLGLHLWMKPQVDTTYALAFEELAAPLFQQTQQQAQNPG